MAQTTSVSSSRPRCLRSLSRPAIGWSTWLQSLAWFGLEVGSGRPRRRRRRWSRGRPARTARRARPAGAPRGRCCPKSRRRRLVEPVERPASRRSRCAKSTTSGTDELHAERQLVRLDAGPQGRIVGVLGRRPGVESGRAARTRRPAPRGRRHCPGVPKGRGVLRVDAQRHAVVLGAEITRGVTVHPAAAVSQRSPERRRTAAGRR